jgi:hypothetical protein
VLQDFHVLLARSTLEGNGATGIAVIAATEIALHSSNITLLLRMCVAYRTAFTHSICAYTSP